MVERIQERPLSFFLQHFARRLVRLLERLLLFFLHWLLDRLLLRLLLLHWLLDRLFERLRERDLAPHFLDADRRRRERERPLQDAARFRDLERRDRDFEQERDRFLPECFDDVMNKGAFDGASWFRTQTPNHKKTSGFRQKM